MKALRAQGVSLEIIAGAYHMDVAEVEGILGKEELGAQERVVVKQKHAKEQQQLGIAHAKRCR